MNFTLEHPFFKCHEISDGKIYFTKTNEIIVHDYNFKEIEKTHIENKKKDVFSFSYLLSKIIRREIFNLTYHENSYVFSFNNCIIIKGESDEQIFNEFKGNRPLRILNDKRNAKLFFGEYFRNGNEKSKEREIVKIYSKELNADWKSQFTFKKNEIRHVHNIIYDTYENKYIVLTGDSNKESKILAFNLDFKKVEVISQGDQLSRSIEIIPLKEGYIIPTDTPKEKNFIYFLNKLGVVVSKTAVDGSIFHISKYEDFYLATTALEPSLINNQEFVYIYGSLDGLEWVEIAKLKKKHPLFLSKILRYSEIELTKNVGVSFKYVPFFFRNIKGFKDGTYFVKKEEIVAILSCKKV